MINKVTLVGNLGKDPEVRHLENGTIVARLALATNENYKDKNDEWQTITEWHNIVAWRGLANYSERRLKKGNIVYVEGKLTTRKWQDKDGNDRYNTEVVANVIKSLERRDPNEAANFKAGGDAMKTVADPTKPAAVPEAAKKTVEPTSDDDLPF